MQHIVSPMPNDTKDINFTTPAGGHRSVIPICSEPQQLSKVALTDLKARSAYIRCPLATPKHHVLSSRLSLFPIRPYHDTPQGGVMTSKRVAG